MRGLVFSRYYVSCTLIFLASTTTAFPDAPMIQRQEFIAAMQRIDDEQIVNQQQQEIQQRLRSAAIRVTPDHRELYNQNGNQYNGANEYANKYYNYQGGQNYYEPVDLSEFAFKYVGCQDIATWSDNHASAGQTPTAMRRFVTFRLCEANTCSTYNKYGCNNHYGEYVIPMEDYLDIMTTYHFKQYSRYCQTCEACSKFDYTLYLNKVAAYQSYVNQMNKRNQNNNKNNNNNSNGSSSSSSTNDDTAADDASTNADDAVATDDAAATDDATTDDTMQEAPSDDGHVTYDDALGYKYGAYGYNFYDDAFKSYAGSDDDTSNQIGDDFGINTRLSYSSNSYSNNGASVYNKNFGNYVSGGYYGGNIPAPKLPWYIASDGTCLFKSACQNFKGACRAYNANATNYIPYFSCRAFQMGNAVSYVGPHCRSDGHTIGIALYKDQYCSSYVGDVSEIEKYTGKKFDDSELSLFYDKSCISCKASESYALATSTSSSRNSGSGSGSSTVHETYPFCTVAYDSSAKCNKNFKSTNALYEDDESQSKVCTFIDTLIENHYNERGQIVVKEDFRFSKWNSGAEYISLAQKASPIQLISLITSMAISLSLLIYSVHLYKKLMYRMPWRPPKSVHSPTSGGQSVAGDYDFDTRVEAGRLSRINSGITALRSISYDGHSVSAFSQFPAGPLTGQATQAPGGILHGDLSYSGRSRHGNEDTAPSAGEFA